MVKSFVDIDEHTNWILNIIKAKYNLKNKSEAVEIMAQKYEEEILEPELRPEYIKRLKKYEKEKTIKVKNIKEFFELE
ncbi:DUF2683 family protein [Candidatus Micrarchaeota archaeon]|nr:DUF2683 family protein [Candidatus Micrarchaeota archaeon]